ncbi:hypothetical protein [Aquabacterium sp.]|uniref:hypothetical protein n=1 Tax=Aquabacterium sp. TaxID=1872578 RepID=UPI0025C716A2|nr:hypothetical protein [Aquabacterium sp.]
MFKRWWSAAALSLCLTACGGGGGADAPTTGGEPPAGTVTVTGQVVDTADAPLAGVTVTHNGVQATTDAEGRYSLQASASSAARTVVQFSLAGYARQTGVAEQVPAAGSTVQVPATLQAVALSTTFNPAQAQSFTGGSAAPEVVLTLNANSLVRPDGSRPQGQATVQITPIDPSADLTLMPGAYRTATGAIESFGALQVELNDADGSRLNLASGQTAVIRIPAVKAEGRTLPTTIPLFHFNEDTGLWVQEGSATLADDAGTGAPMYVGTVSHFSTWNADQSYDTVVVNGCVQDQNGQRVGAGLQVLNQGVDYLGSSQAYTDAQGRFSIPVKATGLHGITAVSFAPAALSPTVQVQTQGVDVTVNECWVIDLEAAQLAAYAGTYEGTFSGSETGVFSVVVASDGRILGDGRSAIAGDFTVQGQVSASGQVELNAASGQAGLATFAGNVNAATGALSGTWAYLPVSGRTGGGSFTGQRQ